MCEGYSERKGKEKRQEKERGIQLRTLYSIFYTSITMFSLYRHLVCITTSSLFLFPLVFRFVSMITWFFFVSCDEYRVIWNACDTFTWSVSKREEARISYRMAVL